MGFFFFLFEREFTVLSCTVQDYLHHVHSSATVAPIQSQNIFSAPQQDTLCPRSSHPVDTVTRAIRDNVIINTGRRNDTIHHSHGPRHTWATSASLGTGIGCHSHRGWGQPGRGERRRGQQRCEASGWPGAPAGGPSARIWGQEGPRSVRTVGAGARCVPPPRVCRGPRVAI